MATQGTGSPSILTSRIETLKAGTVKNIAGKTTVTIKGSAMSALQILATLGQIEKVNEAILSARAAVKRAVAAYDEAVPEVLLFVYNYEASLKGLFGVDHPKLRDFGITPTKTKVAPAAAAKAPTPAAPGKQARTARAVAGGNQKPASPGPRLTVALRRPAR